MGFWENSDERKPNESTHTMMAVEFGDVGYDIYASEIEELRANNFRLALHSPCGDGYKERKQNVTR